MSQTRKLLAHALQLNVRGICLRRRRWAIVDLSGHEAGHGWGTGQNLTKLAPALCAEITSVGVMRQASQTKKRRSAGRPRRK
jgi:hypothetical protein